MFLLIRAPQIEFWRNLSLLILPRSRPRGSVGEPETDREFSVLLLDTIAPEIVTPRDTPVGGHSGLDEEVWNLGEALTRQSRGDVAQDSWSNRVSRLVSLYVRLASENAQCYSDDRISMLVLKLLEDVFTLHHSLSDFAERSLGVEK